MAINPKRDAVGHKIIMVQKNIHKGRRQNPYDETFSGEKEEVYFK